MKKRYIVLLIIGFLLIIIFLYAMFIGTSGLTVKEYKITNKNIPTSFHGVKIVHISDIHYGRTINEKRLKHIVEEINKLKPNIVVLTGDLIDKDTKLNSNIKDIIVNNLKDIDTTLGKYAIYGNHDYAFSEYPTIIEESGFTLLKNSYDLIYNDSYEPIFIGGVDSLLKGNPDINSIMDYYNIEEETEEKVLPNYKIILLHEPDYFNEFKDKNNISLVLSGHSHNGQIRIPFIGGLKKVKGAKIYNELYYKINDTDLYISSGIGTSTINLRLFNRPSINLYRLTKN
jgi:hypothetical protein